MQPRHPQRPRARSRRPADRIVRTFVTGAVVLAAVATGARGDSLAQVRTLDPRRHGCWHEVA